MALDLPSFHDGLLIGVTVKRRSATLLIDQANGEKYALDLEGLEAFQMDDFRLGNIISNVEVVVGHAPDADTPLDRLFLPPHPSAEKKYHDEHASFVQGHVSRIEAGELKLIAIIPSYGADLLAICRNIACRRI